MIGLFLYFILSYVIGIAGIFSIIRITLNYLNVFGFSSTVLSIFVYVMAFISLIQVLLSFKKALKSFKDIMKDVRNMWIYIRENLKNSIKFLFIILISFVTMLLLTFSLGVIYTLNYRIENELADYLLKRL